MKAIRGAAILAVALSAGAAGAADFEGVVEGRITGMMAGTFRAQVGKGGIRSEVEMGMPAGPRAGGPKGLPQGMPGMPASMKQVTLQRRGEPGKVYMLDPEKRSYRVLDTAAAREQMKEAPAEKYTVKKVGKDRVAGFACEKVVATGEKSGDMELCVTSEIAPEWARSALDQGQGEGGLVAALRKAGVQGYPVRWSRQDGRGGSVAMELTSAKRQSVPASTFEIPAGWEEAKGAAMPGAPPGMSGDAQQQMEEALKQLSPEQRKQMEQMMRGQGKR